MATSQLSSIRISDTTTSDCIDILAMFVSFVILPYVAIDMAFVIISELNVAGLKSELKIEPILIETAAHYTATGPLVSC